MSLPVSLEIVRNENRAEGESGAYTIVGTYESGNRLCMDQNIKTERGAKARLTYFKNWVAKRRALNSATV